MKASALIKVLAGLITAQQPVLIWGAPGIGKSAIAGFVVTDLLQRELIDVRACLLDPVDLRGVPHVVDGRTVWCPPSFLPSDPDSTAVIFLDELAQAAPAVQAALLQLCLDRRIGEYELPKGVSIIAASNRQEDRAGAHRLISPLMNRFVHYTLDVSVDEWREWAIDAGIDTSILAYMAMKPGALHDFDPKSASNAFPSPRSWEFTDRIMRCVPREYWFEGIAGSIGEGHAAEFMAFRALRDDLPNPDEMLANPSRAQIPTKPSVQFALIGALIERLNENPELIEPYADLVTRLPAEFAVLAIRDVCRKHPGIMRTQAAAAWLKANKSLMLGR